MVDNFVLNPHSTKRGAQARPWGQFPRALNREPLTASPAFPRFPSFPPFPPPFWPVDFPQPAPLSRCTAPGVVATPPPPLSVHGKDKPSDTTFHFYDQDTQSHHHAHAECPPRPSSTRTPVRKGVGYMHTGRCGRGAGDKGACLGLPDRGVGTWHFLYWQGSAFVTGHCAKCRATGSPKMHSSEGSVRIHRELPSHWVLCQNCRRTSPVSCLQPNDTDPDSEDGCAEWGVGMAEGRGSAGQRGGG